MMPIPSILTQKCFSHNRMSMEETQQDVASVSSPEVGDTAPEEPEQVPDQESLQPTSTSDAAAVPHPHPPSQVNLIHNTTFNGYEILEITQVESLIKQIPNESPYTDILHHEDEEAHVRGKALTKKELAKMSKEAKILNIADNKKQVKSRTISWTNLIEF